MKTFFKNNNPNLLTVQSSMALYWPMVTWKTSQKQCIFCIEHVLTCCTLILLLLSLLCTMPQMILKLCTDNPIYGVNFKYLFYLSVILFCDLWHEHSLISFHWGCSWKWYWKTRMREDQVLVLVLTDFYNKFLLHINLGLGICLDMVHGSLQKLTEIFINLQK